METKLRRLIYATFGITFVLIVAIVVIWKLKFYDDVNTKLTTTNASYETQKTTAATLSSALLDAAVAKERLALSQDEMTYFRSRFRGLKFDITSDGARNATWIGYMNEYFADFGLQVRRQLLEAAEGPVSGEGVSINTSVKIDAPPQKPEDVAVPPSGLLKPVSGGTMTVEVTGTLPHILNFLDRVTHAPILMTVGAIKLEGTSPDIKATFTITPYLVASGPSMQLGAVAAAPAAAAPGAAPGVPPA